MIDGSVRVDEGFDVVGGFLRDRNGDRSFISSNI